MCIPVNCDWIRIIVAWLDYYDIPKKDFPLYTALAIMDCESGGCNPCEISPDGKDHGIVQFHCPDGVPSGACYPHEYPTELFGEPNPSLYCPNYTDAEDYNEDYEECYKWLDPRMGIWCLVNRWRDRGWSNWVAYSQNRCGHYGTTLAGRAATLRAAYRGKCGTDFSSVTITALEVSPLQPEAEAPYSVRVGIQVSGSPLRDAVLQLVGGLVDQGPNNPTELISGPFSWQTDGQLWRPGINLPNPLVSGWYEFEGQLVTRWDGTFGLGAQVLSANAEPVGVSMLVTILLGMVTIATVDIEACVSAENTALPVCSEPATIMVQIPG